MMQQFASYMQRPVITLQDAYYTTLVLYHKSTENASAFLKKVQKGFLYYTKTNADRCRDRILTGQRQIIPLRAVFRKNASSL